MGAQRVSVAQPVRGLPGLIKRAGAHGGNHAAAHAQRAGLLTHGGQVGGELGRVQVAVGVNPARHGGRGKAASNSVRRHERHKRPEGADFRRSSNSEAGWRKALAFAMRAKPAPKLRRRLGLRLCIASKKALRTRPMLAARAFTFHLLPSGSALFAPTAGCERNQRAAGGFSRCGHRV